MKISIFLNGEITRKAIVERYSSDSDIIIAADGGLITCIHAEINPDYIVGDLDSVDLSLLRKKTEIVRIQDQNKSDIQKALEFALKFQPTEIHFFSIFGNRMDHHISNLYVINNIERFIKVFCYDNCGITFRITDNNYKSDIFSGKTISFYSLSGVKNIRTSGLKWNINKSELEPGYFSISNEIVDNDYSIVFDKGIIYEYTLFE